MPTPARNSRHASRPPALSGAALSIVDLHTHTNRSDGVLEPSELIRDVAAAGVRTLAITDHDTLAAYRELMASPQGFPAGLELISGVEINAISRGVPLLEGELHILGFGVDPGDEVFEAALARQRVARRLRFERTVARLREIGLPIDDQLTVLDLTRDDALGRPTIGRALVRGGFATSVDDAFQRLIGYGGPAYVSREGMGPREAIEAIRSARGIPVLAHFSEAPQQIPLLRELRDVGLRGLEVYYRSFTKPTVTAVGAVATGLGFVASGGSDYHGDLMTYAETHAALEIPSSVAAAIGAELAR